MKLKAGDKAPSFELPDQDGTIRKLSDYRGGWLLVYFYPKDDTPGCTREACTMRDKLPDFKPLKASIVGISSDSVRSHEKFSDKFGINFPILADETKATVEAYGVWGKKKFMGREYFGIFRTSFLIGPTGRIRKIYDAVKPETHAEEVLADLESFAASRD